MSCQGWSRGIDGCLRYAALAFTPPIIDWAILTMGRDGGRRRRGLVAFILGRFLRLNCVAGHSYTWSEF